MSSSISLQGAIVVQTAEVERIFPRVVDDVSGMAYLISENNRSLPWRGLKHFILFHLPDKEIVEEMPLIDIFSRTPFRYSDYSRGKPREFGLGFKQHTVDKRDEMGLLSVCACHIGH